MLFACPQHSPVPRSLQKGPLSSDDLSHEDVRQAGSRKQHVAAGSTDKVSKEKKEKEDKAKKKTRS